MVRIASGIGKDGDFPAILPESFHVGKFGRIPVDHDEVDIVEPGQILDDRKVSYGETVRP